MKRRAQRHTRGPYLGLRSCGGLEPIPAFMSREAGARSPVYLKANKKRQTPIQFHSHTCGHFSHQLIQHGSLWIVGGKQTTWRLSSMHRKRMQTPGKRRYSTRYLIFPLLFTKSRRVETMNRLLDLIFLETISFTFCIIKCSKFISFGKSVEKRVGDVTKASAKWQEIAGKISCHENHTFILRERPTRNLPAYFYYFHTEKISQHWNSFQGILQLKYYENNPDVLQEWNQVTGSVLPLWKTRYIDFCLHGENSSICYGTVDPDRPMDDLSVRPECTKP